MDMRAGCLDCGNPAVVSALGPHYCPRCAFGRMMRGEHERILQPEQTPAQAQAAGVGIIIDAEQVAQAIKPHIKRGRRRV